MAWQSSSQRRLTLLSLALLAVGLQAVLETTRAPGRRSDHLLKLAAARKAAVGFEVIRRAAAPESSESGSPKEQELVGPGRSAIVDRHRTLGSRLASLNPNWAALLVEYLREAGVAAGDPVAVSISGSLPALNICLFAALEVLNTSPVVITSVGASTWGASDPDLTWLDMEALLREEGVFRLASIAATLGGSDDAGGGVSVEGRRLMRKAIERRGIVLVQGDDIHDAISRREEMYRSRGGGRPYKIFVDIDGGSASLGNHSYLPYFSQGLVREPPSVDLEPRGILTRMVERGVPVLHLTDTRGLARVRGLPLVPDPQPLPGEGAPFVPAGYNLKLAAVFLIGYCVVCGLALLPELRRLLLGRRSHGAFEEGV